MRAIVTAILHALLVGILGAAQQFDPYQLNGGLVSAVAGNDYVLIASDTRLTDGGYGVRSRSYLNGRIWRCSSDSSSFGVGPSSWRSSSSVIGSPAKWDPDGSLSLPAPRHSGTVESICSETCMLASIDVAHLPIMVGSAGCASDCESLKRRLRLELDSLGSSFGTVVSMPAGLSAEATAPSVGVRSVANLLQQILYSRRSFPYYSFCVLAGLEIKEGCIDIENTVGAVYVYDAIGSYERVAVASAGTGRELLQPVLDRLFSGSSVRKDSHGKHIASKTATVDTELVRDTMSIRPKDQRMGVAGSLRPPVQTYVNCSWEEAVQKVVRGYRSVSEREISVGDRVVVCVVRLENKDVAKRGVVETFSFPLKKH